MNEVSNALIFVMRTGRIFALVCTFVYAREFIVFFLGISCLTICMSISGFVCFSCLATENENMKPNRFFKMKTEVQRSFNWLETFFFHELLFYNLFY